MKQLLLLIVAMFTISIAHAQVTTASISGKVTGANEELLGANVTATHTPTGTLYGVTTQLDGSFTIPNMRVGGPYVVEVSYLGFETDKREGVQLSLGQRLKLNFDLKESGVTAAEVVITGAADPLLNNEKTGAGTTIGVEQIANLPTIARSSEDYTRLNPMAAEGGSFAGRNDQFNNYSVNGTIFNNPFGLDAATPGGQSDAQPISLDAIDQITVNIAPYDVTQSGFTGASVNAVTKSGTNNFEGTAYGFFRNSSMTGGKVGDQEVNKGDLSSFQSGLSIGGPLVKNKLFFFANVEFTKRSDLGSPFVPNNGDGTIASNESRVLESDMQMISDLLMDRYGYETGSFRDFRYDRDNTKALLKLDYNINANHKLAVSYNYLDAFKEQPAHPSAIGRRGPDFFTLQFENSGYRINNKIHSTIAELNSLFGSKYSNNLKVGYTAFRDNRDPFSSPFPSILIEKEGVNYIAVGHEPFSINNELNQDVIQITNNFNMYLQKHTITVGTSFEKFSFDNSFNLGAYPGVFGLVPIPGTIFTRNFGSIEEFQDSLATGFLDPIVEGSKEAFANNNANDSWALAETNLGQWGFYVQDEIALNDRLNVTAGLRFDLPLYFNTADLIQENIDRNPSHVPDAVWYDAEGNEVVYDHTELPKGNLLINPRLGFNYDMNGDQTAILRGGTGLFAGRFPFVWVGNQVANPNIWFYNMTDPDFKFPQIWRSSLGYDRKVGDWTATVDLLYTRDMTAHMVQNHGLKLPTGQLAGVDSRPYYLDADKAGNNAYVFTNTDAGRSFNASFQIQRAWKNNYFMLGYNFMDAQEVNSIDAEISSDAYDRNPANIEHTNKADLAPSLYGNRHRLIGAASRTFTYAKEGMATTVSLIAEYAKGGRYSYTYSGDINNDGSGLNDLMYVPTPAQINEMVFSGNDAAQDAQRSAFEAYIQQDDYLSERRGEYTERYGAMSPWYSKWDLRVLQDLPVSTGNKFQISLDVLNVGNLINSNWGVREVATFTGLAQPMGVSVGDDLTPVYSFDTNIKNTYFDDFGLRSRWQAQIGLRYIFK